VCGRASQPENRLRRACAGRLRHRRPRRRGRRGSDAGRRHAAGHRNRDRGRRERGRHPNRRGGPPDAVHRHCAESPAAWAAPAEEPPEGCADRGPRDRPAGPRRPVSEDAESGGEPTSPPQRGQPPTSRPVRPLPWRRARPSTRRWARTPPSPFRRPSARSASPSRAPSLRSRRCRAPSPLRLRPRSRMPSLPPDPLSGARREHPSRGCLVPSLFGGRASLPFRDEV
jgi:hypothetical protein